MSNLNPTRAERHYVRHQISGQRGYIVEDAQGVKRVRLDRPEPVTQPYDESLWQPDETERPWTRAQCAKIAFEADKALCMLLGRPEKARREWRGLSPKLQGDWLHVGPQRDPLRREMYQAIMGVLKPKMRE